MAVCGAAGLAAQNAIDVRDSVIAVVDQDVITHGQVMDAASPHLKKIAADLPLEQRDKQVAEILRGTLRDMVDERLLVSEAERLAKVNEPFRKHIDTLVQEEMEKERRKAGGDIPFRDQLKKSGLTTDEYQKQLRRGIMRGLVFGQFVVRGLSVSPEEIRQYYQDHLDEFREPEQVRYHQIFIRVANPASREEARKQAADIMDLLGKEYDFAALARDRSDGPHAAEGGLWDFQNRGARPPEIDNLLFSLPVGKVGGPVETELGFYILRVEERREGRLKPFEEAQSQIERDLLSERRRQRYADLMTRLQNEHHVELVQ